MTTPETPDIRRLRESEEKYRKMIERANDAIFAIDTDNGNILEANPRAVELVGYSEEELIGKPIWELHPGNEREAARVVFETALREGSYEAQHLHFEKKNGDRVAIDVNAAVITYGNKKIIQRICRDVTDRRLLQKQIEYQRDYYHYILDMMPVGLGVKSGVDTSSPKVVFENKKIREMFHTEAGNEDHERWHKSMERLCQGAQATVLDESGVYAEELSFPDGKIYQFSLSYYRDLDGSWSELQVVRDVTHRRKLEEKIRLAKEGLERKVEERTLELRQKQAQLVQSEKMAALGHLVAGVAHEINTPIGALKSNNDLFIRSVTRLRETLLADGMPEVVRGNAHLNKMLESIDGLNSVNRTALERIVAIVNSLRRFARLDEAERALVDLHEGLESTLTLVHHELKNRINVHKDYGKLPQINCYPNQLNQVYMNVLINAAQAIEDRGDIYIRTYERGGRAVVEMRDTGKGIPRENLDRIFDPGFTTKGSGVGTGLGLSIVYQIVKEAHGGDIEVDSEVGKGTTFRIIIPIN